MTIEQFLHLLPPMSDPKIRVPYHDATLTLSLDEAVALRDALTKAIGDARAKEPPGPWGPPQRLRNWWERRWPNHTAAATVSHTGWRIYKQWGGAIDGDASGPETGEAGKAAADAALARLLEGM